ncbi:MAG TPA: hypothetical protein VJU61_00480, partial [Polyangiaceae bacterium]|nr:hypothetical protein [Polyangiaceae bacterium]
MADSFSVVTSPATNAQDRADSEPPAAAKAPATASADTGKLPLPTKLAYAMGGSTDIFGHWLYNNLVDPVYNVFLGLSPSQVSITRAVTLL